MKYKYAARATLGRWFSWWWANKDLRKVWWSKLSSLVYSLMQTGRMPAAKLFQNLTSDSHDEAAEKVRSARQAEKKKKKKKQPRRKKPEGKPQTQKPVPF